MFKALPSLLEAIDRDGAKPHAAAIQHCEKMRVDQGWEADVNARAFVFSHVFEPEGKIKDTDDGVEMGYVTPATVKTRAQELGKLDIEAIYKQGTFEEIPNFDTLAYLRRNLSGTLKFHQDAADAGLGLIIMSVY